MTTMKLKAQWNTKTNELEYAADEPNVAYSISYLHPVSIPMAAYVKLEQMSTVTSGRAENPHALWICPEKQFRQLMGWPITEEDLMEEIPGEEGANVVWQSTEDGADDGSRVTIILIGYSE